MFYSHEILTSQAYGVATVWYEIYSQQCQYVLTDAERVQAHMRAFYHALGGNDNALDPQAGRSKRKELILQDDPEFDLNPNLPAFHFDDDGNFVIPQTSQASRKTSSQLSPLQVDGTFTGSNRSVLSGFDLSQSPFGAGITVEPFGAGAMTLGKDDDNIMPIENEERELQALDDWGIEIDAEGNIMPAAEESQLPRLSQLEQQEDVEAIHQDEFIRFDDQGDVIMSGNGSIFHSDPPLPVRQERQNEHAQEQQGLQAQEEQGVAIVDEVSSGQAPVRVQRKRRRPVYAPDDQTKITRQELKAWSTNYLSTAEQARQPRLSVTPAEARKNAFNLVFGRGIAGVGFVTGVPGLTHPLASCFAGEGLQARLLSIVIDQPDGEDIEVPRGRRRSALEALGPEPNDAERRVRRRLNDNEEQDSQYAQPQLPRHGDDALLLPGDDELPPVEIGRRAGSVLPDIPSDVPWNRPSSQIPSSSVKGAGAGSRPGSRQVSASPLQGRGSLVLPISGPEIERFSDKYDGTTATQQQLLDSDGFGPRNSGPAGSSTGGDGSHHPISLYDSMAGGYQSGASQQIRAALDREGRNFLGYVEAAARNKGSPDDNNSGGGSSGKKRWVEFEALFETEDRKRAVVAQAFYHILSLATKNVIDVKQDCQGGHIPFGTIRLGVKVAPSENTGEIV
ncbi:hypothetical protein P885DRAFT_67700 [Corynascus similis CBS 632.67]